MIEVRRYQQEDKELWDTFNAMAKNGSFLFYRDYMEYHSDRFEDFSLMVFEKNKLSLLLPANISNSIVYTHQGLTFGGMVIQNNSITSKIISWFNAINQYLVDSGIIEVIYKFQPQFYKDNFGDEDLYLLYRCGAKLISRNITSVIDFSLPKNISRNRSRNYKKAIEAGVVIDDSIQYETFWEIMETNMAMRFNAKPVHSCEELLFLKEKFPKNIQLISVCLGDEMVGGAVLYLFKNVVKVQYAHASEKGKEIGAIDALYHYIIDRYQADFKYLDFGSSNGTGGMEINLGLNTQKEGFGARAAVVDAYSYHPEKMID